MVSEKSVGTEMVSSSSSFVTSKPDRLTASKELMLKHPAIGVAIVCEGRNVDRRGSDFGHDDVVGSSRRQGRRGVSEVIEGRQASLALGENAEELAAGKLPKTVSRHDGIALRRAPSLEVIAAPVVSKLVAANDGKVAVGVTAVR